MWLVIAILIIVVLYLIKLSCEKATDLKDYENEIEYTIDDLQEKSKETEEKYNELKKSQLYIANVAFGEREASEKVALIQKELSSHR